MVVPVFRVSKFWTKILGSPSLTKALHTKNKRCFCSSSTKDGQGNASDSKGLSRAEQLFLEPKVQNILHRVTGFDMDKIFEIRQTHIEPPKYNLLTEHQLDKAEKEAERRGGELVQMAPFMKPWDMTEDILSDDSEIANFDQSNAVFTDITYGIPYRERVLVVRQPDGKLRLANPAEKDRITNIYYPREGKMQIMPTMFENEHLERVLNEHMYDYILDRACVQFEPDDPQFIRVSHRTYEHVVSTRMYDSLRSTRHFGGMTFYLTLYKKIDGLLTDMLERDLVNDAVATIQLYHILHPDCKSALKSSEQQQPYNFIKLYLTHDAKDKSRLELALQNYHQSQRQTQKGKTREVESSGS